MLVSCVSASGQPDVDGTEAVEPVSIHVSNSDALQCLDKSVSYLSESQQADVRSLVKDFSDLFRDTPVVQTWPFMMLTLGMLFPLNSNHIGWAQLSSKRFKRK